MVSGRRTGTTKSAKITQILLIDIARAYLVAKTGPDQPTYVDVPNEHPEYGKKVGLLMQHLYGTLGAADGWQEEFSCALIELGFAQGTFRPRVFPNIVMSTAGAVHGGGFAFAGPAGELGGTGELMSMNYELTE